VLRALLVVYYNDGMATPSSEHVAKNVIASGPVVIKIVESADYLHF
jgi:hypothetical protein